MSNALCLAVLLASLIVSGTSREDTPAEIHARAERVSADLNAPVSELFWGAGLHGRAAITVPLKGQSRGEEFQLRVPAFIELYNRHSGSWVPFEYWRARISLDAVMPLPFSAVLPGTGLFLRAALEHEGDHATAPISSVSELGFLNLTQLPKTPTVAPSKNITTRLLFDPSEFM